LNSATIQNLTPADFNNPPPAGVEFTPLSTSAINYADQAVSEGPSYSYRLMACDSAPASNCGVSSVATANAGQVPLSFSLPPVGSEELVLHTTMNNPPGGDGCPTAPSQMGYDLPDVFARAVLTQANRIVLISGNSRGNFNMRGSTFTVGPQPQLHRDCTTTPLDSHFDNNPANFNYQFWVGDPYRDPASSNPSRIYAIVDHEYHDTINPPCDQNPCWYNAILSSYSDDDGHTFTPPTLVAALPYAWDPHIAGWDPVRMQWRHPPPHGYFPNSNIFKKSDGYYYAFIMAIYDPRNSAGSSITCLMRTNDLSTPSSWRFWDGTGFNHQTRNPYGPNAVSYATAIANPSQYFCSPIDTNINELGSSITFNTYLQKYMMIGTRGNSSGNPTCGFYYALSNDLFHWSIPSFFRSANQSWCNTNAPVDVYPSAIDHAEANPAANDPNFEKSSSQFYLYFSHNSVGGIIRDLMREPVTITHL
jgi:hypothetical protein